MLIHRLFRSAPVVATSCLGFVLAALAMVLAQCSPKEGSSPARHDRPFVRFTLHAPDGDRSFDVRAPFVTSSAAHCRESGAVIAGRQWRSSDGRRSVVAQPRFEHGRFAAMDLIVTTPRGGSRTVRRNGRGRVWDVAWSPTGDRFAVLVVSERLEWSLRGMLAVAGGHPIRYQEYTVEMYSAGGELLAGSSPLKHIRATSGQVCWAGAEGADRPAPGSSGQ